MDEFDSEIERLKMKKVELTNKFNITDDYEEKEEIKLHVQRIQHQIDTLEKFKKKV